LSWDIPELSLNDTLIGYNVYRNNILWKFQSTIGAYCHPYDCPDQDFLLTEGFWIKVTAIYNYNHLESIANDSILDPGYLIGVGEKSTDPVRILSNPVKKGEMIKIKINESLKEGKIILFNTLGSIIRESNIQKYNSIFEWDTCDLPTGLYYLNAKNEDFTMILKIIIK